VLRALPLLLLCACSAVPAGPDGGGAPPAPDGGLPDAGPSRDAGSEPLADAGYGPLGAPSWFADFTLAGQNEWIVRKQPQGEVTFAVPNASANDNAVAFLRFPGNGALTATDLIGPRNASEIATARKFLYGTFRFRAQLATCAPGEEVVNGLFTYFNDGTDTNANTLDDNSEIDIEVLCGQPYAIWLSSWTDYRDRDGKFLKLSRVIDTRTGQFYESVAADSYDIASKGTSEELRIPGFPQADAFYELGFEWTPERVRWFIQVGSREVTLWDLRDTRYIPTRAAQLMVNAWHAQTHWLSGAEADYPAQDAVMRVDWVRHWERP
jgi:beta-glucanase (GH16 family)